MSDNKKTDELLPHPFNVKVYDAVNWKTDVDAAFLKSIQDYGIRQPIVYARLSFDDGKSSGITSLAATDGGKPPKRLDSRRFPLICGEMPWVCGTPILFRKRNCTSLMPIASE